MTVFDFVDALQPYAGKYPRIQIRDGDRTRLTATAKYYILRDSGNRKIKSWKVLKGITADILIELETEEPNKK